MFLTARNLTLQINGKRLLDGVSLDLAAGERLGICGPSGGGKTLLLRSVSLLQPCDEGEVRWLGEPVTAGHTPHYRSQVMYLPQRPALWLGTVEENLRKPLELSAHHRDHVERAPWIELLGRLGREESFLRQSADDLSGGERQMVALVRALALAPRVLLLDEPTAAMDPATEAKAEAAIKAWVDEDPARACVCISHDRRWLDHFATRITEMRAGRIVSQDTACQGVDAETP